MDTSEKSIDSGEPKPPAVQARNSDGRGGRAAILEAVALSAEGLIGTGIGEPDLSQLLTGLGVATDSDRAYVFVNQTDARGTIVAQRRCLWTGGSDQSSAAESGVWDFLVLDMGLRRWADVLRADQALMGTISEFPPNEQRMLINQGVKSILLLPIFVRASWWGFLGLDNCRAACHWSSGEIDALRLAVRLLGTAQENTLTITETQNRAQQLEALHDVSRTVSRTLSQDTVLQLTLEHICELLDARAATAYVTDLMAGEAVKRAAVGEPFAGFAAPARLPLKDSVTGQVMITGRPVFLEPAAQSAFDAASSGPSGALPDSVQSELGRRLADDTGQLSRARSAVFVPLVVGEHVLGTLNIGFDRARRFSNDEKRLLSSIGQQAGIALANARLLHDTVNAERKARRRADQLAALHEIDRAINSSLEPRAVYARIVEQASGLLNCHRADLLLIGENSIEVINTAHFSPGQTAGVREASNLSIDHSPFLQAIRDSQSPVAIVDSDSDVRFPTELLDEKPARAILGLPLISRDKTIGFLLLADQEEPRQWQQDEISIAAQLADQAAIAITNARLFANEQKTRQTAETLQEIARIVNASLELDQTLELLLEQLAHLVPYDSAALFLHQNKKLHAAAGLGFPDIGAILSLEIDVDENELFKSVVHSRRPVLLSDAQKDERFGGWAGTKYVRGWLGVPLLMGTELVGLLTVDSRQPGQYDSESARLAQALADHTAVAIYKARLLDDLQHANRELRELDELKGQFVQNVAHELRTPLALVRGNVELLAQGDLDAGVQRSSIQTVLKHTHTLVHLVESITTIQDLNMGILTKEAVDPAELADTAIQLANQKALRAGIHLHSVCPGDLPPIPGDFNVLSQALYQLMDNAIKFSLEGGAVTLRLSKDPLLNELEISVEDQGIGVPQDEHERIFELFYQADGTTTRRFGGTGLGLAIVRRAIRMHDGNVWAESPMSDQSVGSRFVIRLPYGAG